ncbi:MAG TPA: LpxL/LpxP family Kdo(2)-lipid IV(A) lauroyl/palmitoleoyl acyltransferase [Steroidobacteraceae bacterium]|nr:LpxL/LpxP family Kdo(2)-lipid IV(A) lauroyl/palmitoleoyl acyltransferase [Steroidobacteraceae bacterium]
MKRGLYGPRYWPTWLGIGLLRLLEPLPYAWLVAMGGVLGRMIGWLPTSLRRVAARNLELCLPELSGERREELLREHFANLGIALFETAITLYSKDEREQTLARIEGREHLDAALARGKGAILLSAHFTTLEIGARVLGTYVPLNIVYRPTKNALLSEFLRRNRGRHARRAIARDDIRTMIRALKDNEPVWYAPDQSYRKKGAEMVPFFGVEAPTNTATSRLAALTGAAVLPYFPERLPGSEGYRVVIGPPLADFPGESPRADAARFNALIEAQVRRVPAQYLWIHKRFKSLGPGDPRHYAD